MTEPNVKMTLATQPFLFQNRLILKNLPAEDLKILEENSKPENGKRGDVLFRQGAFPNGVYWLKTGKVKIFQETHFGGRQTVYIYSDGDLIAHRQFIAEESNPVSAALLEDSVYMFIPGEIFRGLLTSSAFFMRNLLTSIARDFTVWMNRMTTFSQYPVRQRLVLALLILHEQYRLSGSPSGVVTITRTELAEYVGASLETVVRNLNALKSEHLLTISGRKILLQDTNGLLDILQSEET